MRAEPQQHDIFGRLDRRPTQKRGPRAGIHPRQVERATTASFGSDCRSGRTLEFAEFVPLPFVHQSSPLYLAGGARPGPTHHDNRAVHALARIMLHGRISHIQTSWVKLGVERTQVMLNGGANDLGGTLMEETISRMAGSEFGQIRRGARGYRRGNRATRPSAHHHLRTARGLTSSAAKTLQKPTQPKNSSLNSRSS